MDRYISTLHEIVTRGLNTNSYKFALWRALANLASSRSQISKADLSPLFLEYYWPLEVKYHLQVPRKTVINPEEFAAYCAARGLDKNVETLRAFAVIVDRQNYERGSRPPWGALVDGAAEGSIPSGLSGRSTRQQSPAWAASGRQVYSSNGAKLTRAVASASHGTLRRPRRCAPRAGGHHGHSLDHHHRLSRGGHR